ncbi:hypothetical protein UlMin_016175 [Ulmus minor]
MDYGQQVPSATITAPTAAAQRSWSSKKSLLGSFKCFNTDEWSLEEGRIPKPDDSNGKLPPLSLARKVGAEFLGTLMLIFAATAIAILNPKTQEAPTLTIVAVATGLTVSIIIFSTGHISGAHLNPAVTVAFAAIKHFPWKHVPVYIGAQVLASLCAAFALKGVFHPMIGNGGVTVPSVPNGQAFALEFIVSSILMFVNAAMADSRSVNELAGIAVGATVMLNNFIAGPLTGASMNPVRTLGPAVAANNFKDIWIYFTAPLLGCLAGAGAYCAVKLLPEEDGDNQEKPSRTTNNLN